MPQFSRNHSKGMHSKVLIILSVLMMPPFCYAAEIIRHPKFSSGVKQYGIVDYDGWYPSFTTSVRGLDSRNPKLGLTIDIEHLPDKSNFQLDLTIQCGPSAAEDSLQYILPFTFHGETLCKTTQPFTVTTVTSQWLTADHQPKYSLRLDVKRVLGGQQKFQETLKHYVKLTFAFRNDKWRIEANSIYLWNWDSAFEFNNQVKAGKSHPQFFLTDEAMDLMLNMRLQNSKRFDSVQVFDPAIMNLISGASEYVRNYANIEAIMLLGSGISVRCSTHLAKFTAVFSTRKSGVIEQHDKMLKVAQVDSETGKMTFSRYGLSMAMTLFYDEARKLQGGNQKDDFRLRICAGIESAPAQNAVSSFNTVELLNDPKLDYKSHGSLHDDCQIFGSSTRRVTLFARSGVSRIICPIICSNYEEPYLFFREKIALTPKSTNDRTSYLNNGIYAYKAGTVIELRNDLTHEDAGQYSCTAGNHTVTFEVSVVSLPIFTTKPLLSGKELIGSLPTRIYAIEGEGYSVSCTVHFTGVQSVTLAAEFYLKFDSPDGKFQWKKVTTDAFMAEARDGASRSQASISDQSTSYSRTLTLTVQGISREGKKRPSFFDHRLVCNASASAADMQRYGLPDYSVQSGADVLFVQRPRSNNFETKLSDCCLKTSCSAPSDQCSVEIFLKDELRVHLASIGVKFEAAFQIRGAPFNSPGATFDSALAKAVITVSGSLNSMPDKQRNDFLALWPVFRFRYAIDATNEAPFTILRGVESDVNGDAVCAADAFCLFSTGFDIRISNSLTLANIVGELASTTPSVDAKQPWLAAVIKAFEIAAESSAASNASRAGSTAGSHAVISESQTNQTYNQAAKFSSYVEMLQESSSGTQSFATLACLAIAGAAAAALLTWQGF